jgi:ribonuclease BN (tRNA processing enzyme)
MKRSNVNQQEETMKLHFLGNGSAFNPLSGNTAAYIKEGDRLFLLDCGENIFSRLINKHVLDGIHEVYTAISHTHSDHFGSLGTLISYCYYSLKFKLKLVVPSSEPEYCEHIHTLLLLLSVSDNTYTIVPDNHIEGFNSFRSFAYIRTIHSADCLCYSFLFETDAGGVFYSADTSVTEQLSAFLNDHPSPEALYVETALADYPGSIHLPLARLAAVVPAGLRKKIFLMHLDSDECAEKGRALGFNVSHVE